MNYLNTVFTISLINKYIKHKISIIYLLNPKIYLILRLNNYDMVLHII